MYILLHILYMATVYLIDVAVVQATIMIKVRASEISNGFETECLTNDDVITTEALRDGVNDNAVLCQKELSRYFLICSSLIPDGYGEIRVALL